MTDIPALHLSVRRDAPRVLFEGIGVVNGGGATSVLLKDYPEPQRSQILDLVYRPKFGASVHALLVEIPGDGNATQGSMPSHRHTRDDLAFDRGYTWWILQEATRRNPALSLDGTAWSAPGWIGEDPATRFESTGGDAAFFSTDAIDYYISWLRGLREQYGLELDAIGSRNEKGSSLGFVKALRRALDENGFSKVALHAFDDWPPESKFEFIAALMDDPEAAAAIDVLGAHSFYAGAQAPEHVRDQVRALGKRLWCTEDHVYKPGFDCAISLVECFNENFIASGVTRTVIWYDIAGVYPLEPYHDDQAMILAHEPWSGHYTVRDAVWGYAHYGQFVEPGWSYVAEASRTLPLGGTCVTLVSSDDDYSIIVETKGASGPQHLRLQVSGLSTADLCVWRSRAEELFVRLPDITPTDDVVDIVLDPDAIYSLSTTRGQQKGGFEAIPDAQEFPFPYAVDFDEYTPAASYGRLAPYFADIAGSFELTPRPDGTGQCLRQTVPRPTISWAPDWRPYTIIGDAGWADYEVSADVRLDSGETAGVMGRINHVGTGYGFVPQCYLLEVDASGGCRLIVSRGKANKAEVVGDAEQQAIIRAQGEVEPGGELVLASASVAVAPNEWHRLALRMVGDRIQGWVDGELAVEAVDDCYPTGMAGLIAGQTADRVDRPYFDRVEAAGATLDNSVNDD